MNRTNYTRIETKNSLPQSSTGNCCSWSLICPHQRDLVKWTRNLAYTTGELAVATVLVACFAGWQAWETRSAGVDTKNAVEAANRLANDSHRLADEAKRSADNAVKTAEYQLRACVDIVDNNILKCPLCNTVDIDRPIALISQGSNRIRTS